MNDFRTNLSSFFTVVALQQQSYLIFTKNIICYFLCLDTKYLFVLSLFVQRKNQRKGAGNDKFGLPLCPFLYPLRSTLQAKLRTVSGLPSHHFLLRFNTLREAWIVYGLREFLVKATVLKLAVMA